MLIKKWFWFPNCMNLNHQIYFVKIEAANVFFKELLPDIFLAKICLYIDKRRQISLTVFLNAFK